MRPEGLHDLPELLTADEVAAVLRVSRPTIGKWVNEGKLRAIKFGATSSKGTIRFRRDDIEALLSPDEATA